MGLLGSLLEHIRASWAAAKFERDLRSGRRTYGRQPEDADLALRLGGAGIAVPVPVEAAIAASVIRADGSVEDLGVLRDDLENEVDAAILAAMRAQAIETEDETT